MYGGYARIAAVFCLFLWVSSFVCAVDEDSGKELTTASGLEVDKLLTFASSILATFLFLLTAVAYRRDGRQRLLYVSVAFFLFAVKGFVISSEIFIPEQSYLDIIASFLDFAILACFFAGLMRK
ncbi:MAG: hypothetical protein ABIH11_08490 [Candidatus Altiarchaeota archaeon]